MEYFTSRYTYVTQNLYQFLNIKLGSSSMTDTACTNIDLFLFSLVEIGTVSFPLA